MSSVTFPNGQVLASTAITPLAFETQIQALTCGMLGINPVDPNQVRINWQTQGQPSTDLPAVDVFYVACVPENVDYHLVRDRAWTSADTGPVTETWVYTRGWRVSWVSYGPNSTDRMRMVHSAVLFMDYFSDALSLINMYPVSDPPQPTRIPEQVQAEWWERADFHVVMYEQITETIQYGVVTSVEVKVYDGSPDDPVADITVER